MKVLHVITSLQRASGVSVFAGEVANELVMMEHAVTIAVADPSAPDRYPLDSRVKVVGLNDACALKTGAFDVIHIHALWAPALSRMGKVAGRARIPIVWSPHGMLTAWALNNRKWKKRIAWWLYQKRALLRAQMLHVTAESEVMDVRNAGIMGAVCVVPLGVRLSIPLALSQQEKARGRLPGGRRTVLFVSRIQKKKGIANLLNAWAQLKSSMRAGWRLVIAGPDQENHTSELRNLACVLGIEQNVEFIGPVYGDVKDRLYASAEIFVLPTFSENFGSVVIEALATGTPVICTKGAPWGELEVYKCGKWIDIGVQPLVDAISWMMGVGDITRDEMGRRGRQLVEEKYSWRAVAEHLVESYRSVAL